MLTQLTPQEKISFDSLLQKAVPLVDKNWFKTGGNARYFAQPKTMQEFAYCLEWAQHQAMPIFILGAGANILISDNGFDGLVVRPQLTELSHKIIDQENALLIAGAGVTISQAIEYCLKNNLLGLEEFSGIPGTIGGSVYINLHYFEFLLSQFLVHAQVIHKETGHLLTVDNAWFNFGYNQSKLQDELYVLVNATFRVKMGNPLEAAYARGRHTEIIRHRAQRYPKQNTCGSFFRNFYDHEVTLESNGKKLIYVAYYLDKIGVKGALSVGDAIVSYQHANMLVNKGNATSSDIINLARLMQEKVYTQFGILPQPECQLIGFKEYPLL